MATLTEQQRDRLRRDQFAYVDSEGGEHLPINDESHVRNAIARFNQTEIESADDKRRAARKILAAAKRHGIDVDEDSNVARYARRASSSRSSSGSSRGSTSGSSRPSRPSRSSGGS